MSMTAEADAMNTDQIATTNDPSQLLEMFQAIENGEINVTHQENGHAETAESSGSVSAKTDEKHGSNNDGVDGQSNANGNGGKTDSNTGDSDDDQPIGVSTKDGKKIIPYEVLKNTRDRASVAEKRARELQLQLDKLTSSQNASDDETKKRVGDIVSSDTITDEQISALSESDLEILKADFPTVYKSVMAVLNVKSALDSRLKNVENSLSETKEKEVMTVAMTVQEEIDNNPKLSHIQSNSPELFEIATEFDLALRKTPQWIDKPMAERFAKVVELVEQSYGEIKLPGANAQRNSLNQGGIDPNKLGESAKNKLDKESKERGDQIPTSLSEFVSGALTKTTDTGIDAINAMTHHELAEMFNKMTPAQQEEYLKNL